MTRPTGRRRRLRLDLSPGPGLTAPKPRLQLTDSDGVVVAETRVAGAGPVVFDLVLAPGPGAVYRLGTPDGGRAIRADPRILNFRIFAVGWADDGRPTT